MVSALLEEEQQREGLRLARSKIPMRPDHGHTMAVEKSDERVWPGYSFAGRLKGLAELRAVIHALRTMRGQT